MGKQFNLNDDLCGNDEDPYVNLWKAAILEQAKVLHKSSSSSVDRAYAQYFFNNSEILRHICSMASINISLVLRHYTNYKNLVRHMKQAGRCVN